MTSSSLSMSIYSLGSSAVLNRFAAILEPEGPLYISSQTTIHSIEERTFSRSLPYHAQGLSSSIKPTRGAAIVKNPAIAVVA